MLSYLTSFCFQALCLAFSRNAAVKGYANRMAADVKSAKAGARSARQAKKDAKATKDAAREAEKKAKNREVCRRQGEIR